MGQTEFSETPVVAIFVLDGAVSLYAETLRYLAWKLTNERAEIVRFGCAGELAACTSLVSVGRANPAGQDKAPVCSRCRIGQKNISANTVFEIAIPDRSFSPDEAEFLSQIRNRLQESKQIASVMDMSFDGIDLVRIAFFDFAIETKFTHFAVLKESALERFIAGVIDQLILLRALKRFSARKKISHALYINGNYSLNTLIRAFFDRQGVQCISVEIAPTSQRILNKVFLNKDRMVHGPEGLLAISAIDANASSLVEDAEEVLQAFGGRIYGNEHNAYTSLRQDAAIASDLATLNAFMKRFSRKHAFFLSSEDEIVPHTQAHKAFNGDSNLSTSSPGGFASQTVFLQYLIHAAGQHPDIGFVIRLHPRMAANKRDLFESEEHRKYKKLLSEIDIPGNVFVLYGDSKISSYYVVSRADLVIVTWSTIGLEAALLGIPVVSVFPPCLGYPLASFSRQPKTKAELEAALFSATEYGAVESDLLIRWLAAAYAGQFFATSAQRAPGGKLGKVYRACYEYLSNRNLYNLIARSVNHIPSARVGRDDEILLRKTSKTNVASTNRNLERASDSLSRYRATHLQQLAIYGNGAQQFD